MTYATDQRLKEFLNSNQAKQELLCAAILPLDKRFSSVVPQQPWGGADGGKDIKALYNNTLDAYCAVGFVNSANDSKSHRTKISKKFKSDLDSCLHRNKKVEVFVFFTNVNLTVKDREELQLLAQSKKIQHCEIFHRDRIVLLLNSVDGFSIRFQYLQIPLSEAEQASFFAKWGDDIHSLVADGFSNVTAALNRIQFLQEATLALSSCNIGLELDRPYSAHEIGYFRAFCSMLLPEPVNAIQEILFGEADNSGRLNIKSHKDIEKLNREYASQCGMQWNGTIFDTSHSKRHATKQRYTCLGSHSGYREEKTKFIRLNYNYSSFIRPEPIPLKLQHIDECMFIFFLNKSLAQKVFRIHVYANCYKLMELHNDKFYVDNESYSPDLPMPFSKVELDDPWVRLRPLNASCFSLRFTETTPIRIFRPKELIAPKSE